MSEWLKVMLEEIARKQEEALQQAAEERQRSAPGSGPSTPPPGAPASVSRARG